jgi:hypothetical protein
VERNLDELVENIKDTAEKVRAEVEMEKTMAGKMYRFFSADRTRE